MAVRETIQLGHPALKAPNKSINKFNTTRLKDLVQDLTDTMREAGLVGISAPQIAENYKVFVTEPRVTPTRTIDQADELRVFINPEIIQISEEQVDIYEGCGSVMNGKLFGPVSRPKIITIQAYDLEGNQFELKCDGLLSRVIQHEYDHLDGIEFTQKISDYSKLMSIEYYFERIKNSSEQINNSKITIKEVRYL